MPGLRTLALTVAVRGGAKWETEATSGWSHCLEHLVFKGAGDMGAREIVERIEAEGGSLNASTGYERTSFEVRETPPPGPMALPVDKGRFFARDMAGMARALGVADADPNTLFALTSSNPEWQALQPSAPPAAFSNNHLGYALTWFGLARALVGFYIGLLRKTLNQPRSASGTTGKEESS